MWYPVNKNHLQSFTLFGESDKFFKVNLLKLHSLCSQAFDLLLICWDPHNLQKILEDAPFTCTCSVISIQNCYKYTLKSQLFSVFNICSSFCACLSYSCNYFESKVKMQIWKFNIIYWQVSRNSRKQILVILKSNCWKENRWAMVTGTDSSTQMCITWQVQNVMDT